MQKSRALRRGLEAGNGEGWFAQSLDGEVSNERRVGEDENDGNDGNDLPEVRRRLRQGQDGTPVRVL